MSLSDQIMAIDFSAPLTTGMSVNNEEENMEENKVVVESKKRVAALLSCMNREARRAVTSSVGVLKAVDAKMDRMSRKVIDDVFTRATQPEHAFSATVRYLVVVEMVNIAWGLLIEALGWLVLICLGVLAAQIFWAVYVVIAMWAMVRSIKTFLAYRADVKAFDHDVVMSDDAIVLATFAYATEGEWYC